MQGQESLDQVGQLLILHLQGNLTPAEKQQLDTWRNESAENQELFNQFTDPAQVRIGLAEYRAAKEKSWDILTAQAPELIEPVPVRTMRSRWWTIAAAAIVIIAAGGGIFYLLNPNPKSTVPTGQIATKTQTDVAPGTNKATLTLANGQQVVLDSTLKGLVAQQGATKVLQQDGELVYQKDGNTQAASPEYNTLTTKRGEQYPSLVLADGSKVWLNAESSLKFPVSFSGNTREVELTGEGYFEVAKDALRPFTVSVNKKTKVLVLGTHFNVNAYSDEEAIKTTLLEGSIDVKSENASAILKPGQQANILPGRPVSIITNADTQQTVAWKEGFFSFNKNDIATVMRQVARWYDVEVDIKDNIGQTFNGTIPKNVSVSKLFEILESTGSVHFNVRNRKVTVVK